VIGIGYSPSTSAIDVVYTGISVTSPSNATFTQIVGTSIRSRIFLLGNGCIHELMYKSKGTLISKLKMEGRHVKNWTAALEYWRHLLPVINFKYESKFNQDNTETYTYTKVLIFCFSERPQVILCSSRWTKSARFYMR
jgi:hypothetical protein